MTVGLIPESALAKPSTASSRSTGEIIVYGVVQQPLFGGFEFGDVGQRADEADHLAVGTDHRAGAERKPHVMPVGGAHAEILRHAAAPLFEHAVERGAEAVAVEVMEHVEPFGGRAFERTVLEPERRFGFRAGEDFVRGDVPIPDHVAGAGQRQRAALDIGDDSAGHAAGESVLHYRKADQHDDQHEPAKERRSDNVVGDKAEHGGRRADGPDHEQKPGRDQHHRAVEIVGSEIDHQRKAEHRDEKQRYACDAGSDRGREQGDRDQRAKKRQPADGDMGITHVPAVEIEIGEQEHQERRRQDRLARGAPNAFGACRHVEDFGPKTEVDADIDEHRPAKRRSGREHHAALDHEQDGQKQR
jgi:hypothetical protein